MKLSDKAYDILKWLVLIVIPAVTTFYVVLDNLFGWGFSILHLLGEVFDLLRKRSVSLLQRSCPATFSFQFSL